MEESDRTHMRKVLPGRGLSGPWKGTSKREKKITGMNRENRAESWWCGAHRHAEGERE